jgi:AcrR family transcriptional regulator
MLAAPSLPDRVDLSPARRRLFETTLELFGRDGYNGVSVRDIARELHQHPTAIYAHVSSKQELLFELIKIAHEELTDRLRAAVLDAGREPADQLRAIIAANVLTHLEFPALARVAHRESDKLSAEQIALIDVLRQDASRLLRDIIDRGSELGKFRPGNVQITRLAIAAMGAHVVDWWSPELGVGREEVAATHADLAVRMLS